MEGWMGIGTWNGDGKDVGKGARDDGVLMKMGEIDDGLKGGG
jgi:hypothetical protein